MYVTWKFQPVFDQYYFLVTVSFVFMLPACNNINATVRNVVDISIISFINKTFLLLLLFYLFYFVFITEDGELKHLLAWKYLSFTRHKSLLTAAGKIINGGNRI